MGPKHLPFQLTAPSGMTADIYNIAFISKVVQIHHTTKLLQQVYDLFHVGSRKSLVLQLSLYSKLTKISTFKNVYQDFFDDHGIQFQITPPW